MKNGCPKQYQFQETNWQSCSQEIMAVRHKVFMIEQHFDDSVLCDLDDNQALHMVVRNPDGLVIACARLTEKGRLGRIAVKLPYRGVGIGSKLIEQLIDLGQQNNLKDISLNAELENKHLFDLMKFCVAGPVYMKQGIPHQMLQRKLA